MSKTVPPNQPGAFGCCRLLRKIISTPGASIVAAEVSNISGFKILPYYDIFKEVGLYSPIFVVMEHKHLFVVL